MVAEKTKIRKSNYDFNVLLILSIVIVTYIAILLIMFSVFDVKPRANFKPLELGYIRYSLEILGWGVALIFIWLLKNQPIRMKETLRRLMNRGSISLNADELQHFNERQQSRSALWTNGGGILLMVLRVASHVIVYPKETNIVLLIFVGLEIIGFFIMGKTVGRMIFYGLLGRVFKKENITLKVTPGHPDDAAGLRPLGEFYLFQAMVLAIVPIYIIVWWFIIQLFPTALAVKEINTWLVIYPLLLLIAIIAEVIAFVFPLIFIHEFMHTAKRVHLERADLLSLEISELQSKLLEPQSSKEDALLKLKLTNMIKRFSDIENTPTWPLDLRMRRHFAINNLILSVPLIIETIKKMFPNKE